MSTNPDRLLLFEGIAKIKTWFSNEGFLETPVPPMVENPGMEAHLHPFEVFSAKDKKSRNLYLHTSPEFYMKELLSEGLEKIFSLEYCFRDEPQSQTHRSQFLMLEWYRTNADLFKIVEDVENLYRFVHAPDIPIERRSVDSLFKEHLGFSILEFLNPKDLQSKIQKDYPKLYQEGIELWEDLFFLLFLNLIEPKFKNYPLLSVFDFPAPLAALSEIKPEDPRVCLRFEAYAHGVEIANCFQELRDPEVLEKRIQTESLKKQKLYQYSLPYPSVLMEATKRLPYSSGIALGVERFLCPKRPLFF